MEKKCERSVLPALMKLQRRNLGGGCVFSKINPNHHHHHLHRRRCPLGACCVPLRLQLGPKLDHHRPQRPRHLQLLPQQCYLRGRNLQIKSLLAVGRSLDLSSSTNVYLFLGLRLIDRHDQVEEGGERL